MNLTQLPQHILQSVIEETISISSPRDAFRLRLVCKQFNQELLHAAFEKDGSLLISAILDRDIRFRSDVGKFRLLRGFLLRHNHTDNQFNLWEQLNGAVTELEAYTPASLPLSTITKGKPSPDRFRDVYSSSEKDSARETAIALVCDAVLAFLAPEIDLLWMLDSAFDDDELYWENLELKTKEFWVLMVAARRQDMDLFRSTLNSFTTNKDSSNTRAWIDNLADALRIPAEHGFKDAMELVLAQEGVQPIHISRKGRMRDDNAMELAAGASRIDIVRFLLAKGHDLLSVQTDYVKSFKVAIESTTDTAVRTEFLALFMSLTEEWRSKEISAGIIEALCAHGDLATIQGFVKQYQTTENDQQYQWQWSSFATPNDILVKAVKGHNCELLVYIIENREPLKSLLEESFTPGRILSSIETAITEKTPKMLIELLKQPLPDSIMKEKLFMYASITSDTAILETLVPQVDLTKTFDDDSDFWDYYSDNSDLSHTMYKIRSNYTPYLLQPGLLPLGTISLLTAVKAGNIETAKWLLERGQRLGRRYIECSRFLYLLTASLVTEDPALIRGKGKVIGMTLTSRWPLALKQMLEDGAHVTSKTLIITHGRSQREIDKRVSAGKKYTKVRKFMDKFRINVQMSGKLRENDTRVVFGMEVPVTSYLAADEAKTNQEKYYDMSDLLRKHGHPNIYIEYRSVY